MNITDYILDEIKRRGASNAEAIQTHHDCKAGERGASGRNKRKTELKGLAYPRPAKPRRNAVVLPLPKSKYLGRPIVCDGTKGYIRDAVTGTITRCVASK